MLDIKKYTYYADGGSIRLFNDAGATINFCNETGDGEFNFYVVHASGWGPALYKNRSEYDVYEEFKLSFEDLEQICFLSDQGWKVSEYDVSLDAVIELSSSLNYITVCRSGDTFIFFCYEKEK